MQSTIAPPYYPEPAGSVSASSLSPQPSLILVATLLSSSTSRKTSTAITNKTSHVFYSDLSGPESTSQPKRVFQHTGAEPRVARNPNFIYIWVSSLPLRRARTSTDDNDCAQRISRDAFPTESHPPQPRTPRTARPRPFCETQTTTGRAKHRSQGLKRQGYLCSNRGRYPSRCHW